MRTYVRIRSGRYVAKCGDAVRKTYLSGCNVTGKHRSAQSFMDWQNFTESLSLAFDGNAKYDRGTQIRSGANRKRSIHK